MTGQGSRDWSTLPVSAHYYSLGVVSTRSSKHILQFCNFAILHLAVRAGRRNQQTSTISRTSGTWAPELRFGRGLHRWKALDESFPTVHNSVETEFWSLNSRASPQSSMSDGFSAEMSFPGAKLQSCKIDPKGRCYLLRDYSNSTQNSSQNSTQNSPQSHKGRFTMGFS